MAFNNWPYTNFQDLNLGWILAKVKEAFNKATEALTSTTGFDERITTAETNASEANTNATEALATANTADGKATEALSTANNASDTANAASANATQARTDAARALNEVGSAIGSYKIFVDASNHCRYNEELIDAVDILSALQSGRNIFVERVNPDNVYNHIGYEFAYYDIDNSTTPATATVFFDRLISYAGENAIVERMYIVGSSNTAGFTTIQTLASKSYVDSHGGGGSGLPAVTSADNGKFLRVVSGAWAAATSDSEPVITVNDDTIQMNINPNTLYIFPNAGQLTVDPANPVAGVVNEYHFLFYSGATATTLTLPNTIRQPDGFTVEANHWYEVSILENNMLAYGWAVSGT